MSKPRKSSNKGAWESAKRNINRLKPFVELSGQWEVSDAGDPTKLQATANWGVSNAIFEHEYQYHNNKRLVWVYSWNKPIKEKVEKRLSQRDELPCGHSGFRNLKNGGFECCYDKCDEKFIRQTVIECLL